MREAFKPFDPATAEVKEPPKELNSNLFLKTEEPVPASMNVVPASASTSLVLHKSTYPANAPSEDRSTLVVGDGYIFSGVWDGHGGVSTSDYAETKIYEYFKEHYDKELDNMGLQRPRRQLLQLQVGRLQGGVPAVPISRGLPRLSQNSL